MNNCTLVKKPPLTLAGISYSGPYSTFPDEAINLQTEFLARRHELNEAASAHTMYCPYFGNEVFATYWACCEAAQLERLPERMVRMTIPEHEYAMVTTTNKRIGEGYEQLKTWIEEAGLEKLENALAIEIFYIDEHLDEEPVDLLIPIRNSNERLLESSEWGRR